MSKTSRKPYTLVGAGRLTATVWKSGDNDQGWTYRFNISRTSASGRVSQRFRPRDIRDLVKLLRVLAFTLADDGCLDPSRRYDLSELALSLETVPAAPPIESRAVRPPP